MFKKIQYVLAVTLVAASFSSAIAAPVTIDVTATVLSSSLLNYNVLKIADNTADTAVGFGSISAGASAWSNQPAQYVKLVIQENNPSWRVRIYSDNYLTAPSTSTWGFQYGGLKGVINGAKIPMGWLLNPTVLAGGPALGNPTDGTSNGWTYLKDFRDAQDPASTKDTTFVGADAGGYTNIAFGGASYTTIVRPNITGGNETLPNATDAFYLYLEGNFNSAVATTYTGALKLELINL